MSLAPGIHSSTSTVRRARPAARAAGFVGANSAAGMPDGLTARAPAGLVYLSGAGGQQVAILPAEQLVIVRTGKFAPGWRDATLPVMLHEALAQPADAASAPQAAPMAGAGRP